MTALKEYTVLIGGLEHTMQLSPEDAERLEATVVADVKARTVANKARDAAPNKKD